MSSVSTSSPALPSAPVEKEGRIARGLVVSIHDVSPLTHATVCQMLERLEALGVTECSLLVIPDHHRRGHFLDDPTFCHWLQERVQRGDEAIIHGYHHFRNRRMNESLSEKVTTRFYTAGEGEFYDMPGAEAIRVVSQAREEFRKLGLNPRGFIAPAWLLSEGAERALTKLGFAYTVRLGSVLDLQCGRLYQSQSLVWSSRSWWRRLVSRGWNCHLANRLRRLPLARISLHPIDFEYPRLWQQVERLTKAALADRTPITYQRWVETSR